MQGTQAECPLPSVDSSRAALDFVHGLLLAPESGHRGLDGVLAGLAHAFGATAAGLAALADGRLLLCHPAIPVNKWRAPWAEDASLLSKVGRADSALAGSCPGRGTFLLTAFGLPGSAAWLLWLEDEKRTGWTDAEAAALALTGHTLSRRVGDEKGPRWAAQLDRAARQQRLEVAAQVARRLAHDFGNVLTSILGFTELALTQQIPPSSPLHGYLTEVHRGAQSGASLTHRLRLFSRRQAATSRPCTLGPVLTDEENRLRAALAPATLHRNLPDDLPPVGLDADHLRQVLAALLDNAREALNGAGAIRVVARAAQLTEADCQELFGDVRPGLHVEITVADTGTGLSAEVRQRLFAEPFFSTKMRQRGFGLAVAYGILAAHRGGLSLGPGAEGGTVARVVVPVAATVIPSAPIGGPTPPQGEKILVVDDDPMILQLVGKTLEGAGYRVQAVGGAAEAEAAYFAAGADPFRLVLSDVVMPQTSGVELARRLLGRDPGARLLFMSGQVGADFVPPEVPRDRYEMLTKPFRPEGLLRAVRHALDRPLPRRAPVRGGGPGEGAAVSPSR